VDALAGLQQGILALSEEETDMNKHTATLALVTFVVILMAAGAPRASEKIGQQTGKSCVSCHDKPGSKLLTDQGKYFEVMRSLDSYAEVKASFGQCTSCHVRTPGSKKLTKKGKQMAAVAKDMVALRRWVQENHPAANRQ